MTGLQRIVEVCNRRQYPLREFIDRTLGPGSHYVPPTADLEMRWPPYTDEERRELEELYLENVPPRDRFFDISQVFRPADRVAFWSFETPGGVVGHTAGLENVDFE